MLQHTVKRCLHDNKSHIAEQEPCYVTNNWKISLGVWKGNSRQVAHVHRVRKVRYMVTFM